MTDARRIVLHAGLPKTGTTSIQTVFYEHRQLLLDRGRLLYPSLDENLTTPLCTIFGRDPGRLIVNKLAGVTTSEAIAEARQRYREHVDREIQSEDWDTLLLSAEGVTNLTDQELAGLREWGDRFASTWTVLVCVRHPVDYMRGMVQQLVKNGGTLAPWYDNVPPTGFRPRVSKLISTFGRQNVVLFDFESAAEAHGGILGEFATRLGLTDSMREFIAGQNVRRNPSLSREAMLLLDSMNRQHPLFDGGRRAPRRTVRVNDYLHRIRGARYQLPIPIRKRVIELARGDIEWINAEFGLDLYPDVTSPRSESMDREPDDPTLREDTTEDIAALISDLAAQLACLRQLRAGRSAYERRDLDMARKCFAEAARLDPNVREPTEWLARLRRDDEVPAR